ncbi:hypothetical protein [Phenylobacterium sp.]|uniref:hypothetical protein n=1 Tax=Phenylobacterium sp. TaxID=1871053 RepID=UPI002C89EB09|nr:hypothetical protein [Phenylobacterium sp.]HLZ73542.1 hypothetical protein [Phenylobacterium sp.]
MDIHKPKPWHGWPEFAKEIGTIVIGVLIALGAEQAVEWLHHRAEVAEARRALNEEVAFDLASFDFSVAQTGCMTRRLDELTLWLKSQDSRRPLQIAAPLPTIPGIIFRTSVWRVASVAAVAQMPFEARVDYGKFYDAVANHDGVRLRQIELWRDVSRLLRAKTLNDEQRQRAADDLDQLRADNEGLAGRMRFLREYGAALKVEPSASARARFETDQAHWVQAFCKPLLPSGAAGKP